MTDPEGTLTPAQFEIMQLLWAEGCEPSGMTVVEIWEATGKPRKLSRTTTLNLVDRLEKRGWLHREKVEGVFRYRAAVKRQTTESRLANEFVGDFFGGSASKLFLSLLGSRKISKGEIDRLKALLDESSPTSKATKKRRKE